MTKSKISTISFKLGIFCILLSIIFIAICGYMSDNFFNTDKNFLVPDGDILNRNEKNFNFAIISDSGNQNLSLQNIITTIKNSKQNHKFILHLGDFVNEGKKEYFYWLVSEIIPKLKHLPLYTAIGNHDIFSNGRLNKNYYRMVFGQEYYWFSYGNTLFIILDSSESKISQEQFIWTEGILQHIRPLFKNCIILSHVPPKIEEHYNTHHLDDKSTKRLEQLTKNYNINYMFFGHVHFFSKYNFGNTIIYTVPTSGQAPRSENKQYGYIDVSIEKEEIKNIKVNYLNLSKEQEDFDLFFVNTFLSDRVKLLSFFSLLIGISLVLIGYKINNKKLQ